MASQSRTAILVTLGVGLMALVPAYAGASTTTFVVSGSDTLNVSVPASAALGTGAAGGTVSGSLGNVTVTDSRGQLVAEWTASVSSTDFILVKDADGLAVTFTGSVPAEAKVLPAAITYDPGTPSVLVGTATGVSAGTSGAIGAGRTAATFAGVGNNEVQWNPTLTFDISAEQVAGTYSGTITHSVTSGL